MPKKSLKGEGGLDNEWEEEPYWHTQLCKSIPCSGLKMVNVHNIALEEIRQEGMGEMDNK